MIRYDLTYLTSLSHDMAEGDVDACAGFFAATYKEAVKTASKRLGDEYAVQDVIERLYTYLFVHCTRKETGAVLLRVFRLRLNMLCDEEKARLDQGRESVPLMPGRGVNNDESAELLLHYIFRRIGREPCHLPLSAFVAYNEYRISRNTLQRGLIALVLIAMSLTPFVLRKPELTLEANTDNPWAPTYTLVCNSLLPVDSVVAELNGNTVAVSRQQDDSYTIVPTEAGTLDVKVTLVSRVGASIEATVEQVDLDAPKVLSSASDSEHLYVTLTDGDSGSGLDLENAYALCPDGSTALPQSWDNDAGTVVFARLENNSNLYFPDKAGNVLHVVCQYE